MSVVIRTIDRNIYFQVRRKVMTPEGSKVMSSYLNITNVCSTEYDELETEAYQLDYYYRSLQRKKDDFISMFYHHDKFHYISLRQPDNKSGWTVKCIVHATEKNARPLYVSRSVDKHGLSGAFSRCYELLLDYFGYSGDVSESLLKTIWYDELNFAYLDKLRK